MWIIFRIEFGMVLDLMQVCYWRLSLRILTMEVRRFSTLICVGSWWSSWLWLVCLLARLCVSLLVCLFAHLFVTTANRRLTVLMMYQALNRDMAIDVTCSVESSENRCWRDTFYGNIERQPATTTRTCGLAVGVRRQRRNQTGALHMFPDVSS